MKGNNKFLIALASLVLAALSCNTITGGGQPPQIPEIPDVPTFVPPTVDFQAPTQESQSNGSGSNVPQGNPGDVLFQDDFVPGRGEWGTGSDADRTVEYLNEALHFNIVKENYFVWTAPNDTDYSNIHMEVTAFNNGSDPDTAMGFVCYQQFFDEDSYYFAVTPAGDYAIALAALAQDDVFLTNNDQWGSSDLIPKNAATYRIGADCGNGKLTLYVNGQEVASVEDTTYTSGRFALYVWSGKKTGGTDVSYDDFIMTQLP